MEQALYYSGNSNLSALEGNNDEKHANSLTEFPKNSETGVPVILVSRGSLELTEALVVSSHRVVNSNPPK